MLNYRILKNQKGLAIVETTPLLIIFVLILSFCMGIWGIVHTATLHSIAARTYAFETFRHRSNLDVFREIGIDALTPQLLELRSQQVRYHSVKAPNSPDGFIPHTLNIQFGGAFSSEREGSATDHNQNIFTLARDSRNQRVSVNPVWIMVGYGICLNSQCGGEL